jgi:RNA polymerase sigma factor (sigma-70 family)
VLKRMGVSRARYDYNDLFGVGCIGLCNAARVWREDGGSAFSTFAFYAIKHEILGVMIAHERDRCRLISLNGFDECAVTFDCRFEEMESDILINEFCRCANQNIGETAAEVVRLSAAGKNSNQIAVTLGISTSAVNKAKKRARTAITVWLKDGEN